MKGKCFLLYVLCSAVAFTLYSQATADFDEKFKIYRESLIGKSIKAFKLADLDNKKWNSNDLKGKVIVINFWFTACKPCILEMPHLNKLVNENKDKPVVFIAPAPETDAQIKKFLKKYSFDYHIIPSSLEYITALGVENFPTHLVIDKEGIVRQVFIGYADDIKEKLQAEIDKLVKK
jgi:peroxiredoxin